MQLIHLLIATGVIACQGCSQLGQVHVRNWSPDASPANFSTKIVLTLDQGNAGSPGLSLWSVDGRQVASIDCEITARKTSKWTLGEVTCLAPPLAPGNYSLRFYSDRSCGSESYMPLKGTFDMIDPPHLTAASPAHGPENAETVITITGSNIGGPHVNCEFTFPPATGAKFGCSMDASTDSAVKVTPTSAVCRVPSWPGPLTQYDGKGGFKPLEGAACGREVHVQMTNDGRVHSMEPLVFHYDEAMQVLV